MTVQTGIDIIEIDRVRKIAEKFGSRFHARLFTPGEQAYCEAQAKPELHYAARFCAKEAVSKALQKGISAGIRWTDIEIVNSPSSGAPLVRLQGRAEDIYAALNGISLSISLSHSETVAAASAVLLTA